MIPIKKEPNWQPIHYWTWYCLSLICRYYFLRISVMRVFLVFINEIQSIEPVSLQLIYVPDYLDRTVAHTGLNKIFRKLCGRDDPLPKISSWSLLLFETLSDICFKNFCRYPLRLYLERTVRPLSNGYCSLVSQIRAQVGSISFRQHFSGEISQSFAMKFVFVVFVCSSLGRTSCLMRWQQYVLLQGYSSRIYICTIIRYVYLNFIDLETCYK